MSINSNIVSSYGWELVKENSKPLERGREIKILNNYATKELESSKTANKKGLSLKYDNTLDTQKKQFELLIKPYEDMLINGEDIQEDNNNNYSSDPLNIFLNYIKWTENNYLSGNNNKSNLFLLYER